MPQVVPREILNVRDLEGRVEAVLYVHDRFAHPPESGTSRDVLRRRLVVCFHRDEATALLIAVWTHTDGYAKRMPDGAELAEEG